MQAFQSIISVRTWIAWANSSDHSPGTQGFTSLLVTFLCGPADVYGVGLCSANPEVEQASPGHEHSDHRVWVVWGHKNINLFGGPPHCQRSSKTRTGMSRSAIVPQGVRQADDPIVLSATAASAAPPSRWSTGLWDSSEHGPSEHEQPTKCNIGEGPRLPGKRTLPGSPRARQKPEPLSSQWLVFRSGSSLQQ